MIRVRFLATTVVLLLSIESCCVGQTTNVPSVDCDNIFEEKTDMTSEVNCTAELISLNPDLSQQATEPGCSALSVFNLSTVADCNWAESVEPCLDLSPLSFRPGGGAFVFALQDITCTQYTLSEDLSCSCQMECLLSFDGSNIHSAGYAFFGAISCDVSQLDEVKTFFDKPDINITFVSGPSPISSCTMTDDCSPSTSVGVMSPSLLSPSPSSSLFLSPSPSLSLSSTSPSPSLFTMSTASASASVGIVTPLSTTVSPTMELPTIDDKCPKVSPIVAEDGLICSSKCGAASSSFGSALMNACSSPRNSYAVDLTNSTNDTDEVADCLASASPDTLNLLLSNSCELITDKIVCDRCDCTDKEQSCQRTCILPFDNPETYVVLTGLSASGSETNTLLERIASSSCLEQRAEKMLNFDDCSCAPTPILTPSLLESSNDPAPEIPSVVLLVVIAVGLVILLAVLIVVTLCVCLVCRRRRNKCKSADLVSATNKSYSGPNSPKFQGTAATSVEVIELRDRCMYVNTNKNVEVILQQTPMTLNLTKWQRVFGRVLVESSQILIQETIGEGAFGLVHKGVLLQDDGSKKFVAIKTLKGKDSSTLDQVEEFVAESAIMLDFDHPNVIKLLAVCLNTEDKLPLIVLPYMANGDLKSFLQQKRHQCAKGALPEGVSVPMLMAVCLDIAQGMEYLAKSKFVHRDLAARNCMVDDEMRVKVADFGLSRDVYSRDYYRLERRAKLPVKWMPPESLNDNIFNEKSDVWAFGVTCWEVFSLGKTPYPSIDNADIVDYIERGIRLKKPSLCPKEMYILLSTCWDESPEMRPCFTNLVESFRNITTNWRSSIVSDTSKVEDDDELRLSYEQLYSDFSGDSDNSMTVMLDSLGGKVQEVVFRKEDAARESGNSDGSSGHYSHLAPVEDSRVCATNFYYNVKDGEHACECGSQLHPPVPHGVPRAYSSCPSTPQICPHSPGNPCHCCSFEHALETSTSSGSKTVKTSGEHSSFEDSSSTVESSLSGRKSGPADLTTDYQPREQHIMSQRPPHSVVSSNPRETLVSVRPKAHSLPQQSTPYLTPLKLNKTSGGQFTPDEEDERMTRLPQHHYFVLERPPSKQIALIS